MTAWAGMVTVVVADVTLATHCVSPVHWSKVFPTAGAKFFMIADPEIRARRRYDELRAAGQLVDFAQTRAEQEERDRRDSTRAAAPLCRAQDAVDIDTSRLTPDEVVAAMEQVVRARAGESR